MEPRILGLDFGSKTVGVAISDPLLMTAQPLETIWREKPSKFRSTLRRIEEIVNEYDVKEVVMGLPKNMDGTEGERCEATREFADALSKRLEKEIVFVDERLTTVQAAEILDETGVKRREQKQFIDQIAAALILDEYIKSKK